MNHLLAKGANPNTCDDTNTSLLHYAAEYGYIDIVDMLLQHPALITNDIAKGEGSPFWRAAQCNQNTVVERILQVCTINHEGMLYNAVQKGLLNTVRTLLACNFDANSTNSLGYHSLTYAAQVGHVHIMKLLIASDAIVNCHSKNEDHLTPLNSAAYFGYVVAVQLLIDYGADVNIKGGYGNLTPLHCASEKHIFKLIEVLLDNGAYVNAKK